MLRPLLVTAVSALLAIGAGYADQSRSKVTIAVNRAPATDGRQMYSSYCAPCHGADGKGHGPVASLLKTPPPDLTALSRANKGSFPGTHVAVELENGAYVPRRGAAEMPVWGPILAKMSQSHPQDRMLRISNLSRYLETLQVK